MPKCAKTGRSSLNDDSIIEIGIGGGHLVHLSFQGRQLWSAFISRHPLTLEGEMLDEKRVTLKFLMRKNPEKYAAEYLQVSQRLQEIDTWIFKIAKEWLENTVEPDDEEYGDD